MNQIIHAAARRDVTRTEQALRTLPDGDTARAREIRTAWRNLVRELTHHHEAEDEHGGRSSSRAASTSRSSSRWRPSTSR